MHKTSRERERERERESESESSAARGQGSRAARPEGALPARGPSMVVPSLRTPGSDLAAGACQRWAPCWDSAGAPACAEPPRPILNPSSGGVAQTPGGEGGGGGRGGGEKAKEGWGWRAAYQASYEASCRAAHRFSISTAHSSLRARLSSRSG
ncbi:unnamed protein product [Prorocentrum cordatum]|uniref:Uncharacterized protein n=1 Tax=Prorocentrum cordatum TaxID=2364126 RepID=A0ABN9VMS4_9DINO|nr:unnamed protein product [Polarella glacialis]